jgi:hypothetical protein
METSFLTNVKPARVPVPAFVVTSILPVAPAPTIALIVSPDTINDAASVPPNFTDVVPIKLEPLIITGTPEAAESGANAVITGAGTKTNP